MFCTVAQRGKRTKRILNGTVEQLCPVTFLSKINVWFTEFVRRKSGNLLTRTRGAQSVNPGLRARKLQRSAQTRWQRQLGARGLGRSIGPIRNSLLPTFGPATALRTACEVKLPAKMRRIVNSIGASDGNSGGACIGVLRLRLCLHPDFLIILAINQSSMEKAKARGRRKEERTLHPLGPFCRQSRYHDQAPPWRSCECRSDRQFAKPTPSRRAAVRGLR